MHAWQLQDAKARFSELLRSAASDGPQAITVRGRTTAPWCCRGRTMID